MAYQDGMACQDDLVYQGELVSQDDLVSHDALANLVYQGGMVHDPLDHEAPYEEACDVEGGEDGGSDRMGGGVVFYHEADPGAYGSPCRACGDHRYGCNAFHAFRRDHNRGIRQRTSRIICGFHCEGRDEEP
jgi:hypothetical protein